MNLSIIHKELLESINNKKLEALSSAVAVLIQNFNDKKRGLFKVRSATIRPETSSDEVCLVIQIAIDDLQHDLGYSASYLFVDKEGIEAEDLQGLETSFKKQLDIHPADTARYKEASNLAVDLAVLYSSLNMRLYSEDCSSYALEYCA